MSLTYTPKKSEFSKVIDQGGIFFDFGHTAESTPITNRGVKSENPLLSALAIPSNLTALESLEVRAIGLGDKAKFIRTPKPNLTVNSDYSFFDWVNLTFKKEDFKSFEHDDDLVMCLSSFLFDIFGYSVTTKRPGSLNMYSDSWNLGKVGWGYVCIGGQNDSVMVSLTAQGLYASLPGWEKRLYTFINSMDSAKLTRVDLAHDSFNSLISLNDYFDMYQDNKFTSRGRRPQVQLLGDWINENTRGRTLSVGSRKSGKVLRIYEKGYQLGRGFSDEFPMWVRVELEIRASQRILPPEMLLNPAQYLAGAYPALSFICEKQEVIETIKKSTKIKVDSSIEITRHQFGKHIKVHAELFGADATIQILTLGVKDLPDRLDIQDFSSFKKEDYYDSENIELVHIAELLSDFTPKNFQRLDYELFKDRSMLN